MPIRLCFAAETAALALLFVLAFVWLGRHFICRASFSCRREYLHAYVVCLVMPVLLLLAVFLDPTVGVG